MKSLTSKVHAVVSSAQEYGLVSLLKYDKVFLGRFSRKDSGCRQLVHALLEGGGVSSFLLTEKRPGFGRCVFILYRSVACLCLTVAFIFFQLNMLSFNPVFFPKHFPDVFS